MSRVRTLNIIGVQRQGFVLCGIPRISVTSSIELETAEMIFFSSEKGDFTCREQKSGLPKLMQTIIRIIVQYNQQTRALPTSRHFM